ncbi:MAG: spore photoproduct lyase family protein, partial [Mesobacillus sp.]
VIQKRYPKSKLEMDEEKRKYKWGRYGIGKYVYQTDEAKDLENTIRGYIHSFFPEAEIQYFT